jgi:hypothetical protein
MLCTVSTIKDTRAGVLRYVERNLASGADHMFVLLEADDDGLLEDLREHPHVTPVLTDEAYWHGEKPANLNVRQVVNADVVNTVLAFFAGVDWLVHLDGDECLDVDRGRLAELTPEVRCISLAPLEAISKEHWDGEVDRFKRLLEVPELSLLAALGAIDVPSNARYFRGHLQGKAGVRPALDLSLGVHRVRRRAGEAPEHSAGEHLRLLHYESYSGEEFVRKWDAHLSSGMLAGFRPPKTLLRAAVAAVQRNEHLDPEQRRAYLRTIYKRHVEDPVDLLEELGLLVSPDPSLHEREPVPFPAGELRLVESLLGLLVRAPKAAFTAREDPEAVPGLLRTLRACLGPEHADEAALAERIDAVLPGPATPVTVRTPAASPDAPEVQQHHPDDDHRDGCDLDRVEPLVEEHDADHGDGRGAQT